MMKIKELSIGNWVKTTLTNEEKFFVSMIDSKNSCVKLNHHPFDENSINIEDLRPVAISEKILKGFGFEKNKFGYDYPGVNFGLYYNFKENNGLYNTCHRGIIFGDPIGFVHQLQNLILITNNIIL